MKKYFQAISLLIFLLRITLSSVQAQSGLWTWVHGDSSYYTLPDFGIRGIPDSSNVPGGLYAPVYWTGKDGKFWIYGGKDYSSGYYSDMWMFDPDTRMWTWMKGDSGMVDRPAIRGSKGVSSPTNSPGCRGLGCPAWTDTSGNLWLYGGYTKQSSGAFPFRYMSDLWKYDVQINEWTWMSGDSVPANPVYGLKHVPDSANTPGALAECSDYWVDGNNNFWFFGGGQNFYASEYLWRYSPATGVWTWMSGGNTFGHGHYGTQGVFDTLNSPSRRFAHTSWLGDDGKFWLFGGSYDGLVYDKFLNDLWCFDPQLNAWCWFAGDDSLSDIDHYAIECHSGDSLTPANAIEGRAAWTDSDGNLWKFGGIFEVPGNAYTRNQSLLWCFVKQSKQWMLVNSPVPDPQYSRDVQRRFGVLGMPDINSHPGARCGTASFKDNNGVFYLFGGLTKTQSGLDVTVNDMWSYEPDPACLQIAGIDNNANDKRQVLVYPNPVSEILYVKQSEDLKYLKAALLNIHGAVVSSLTTGVLTDFPVAMLAPGIYILRLSNEHEHHYEKVLIK